MKKGLVFSDLHISNQEEPLVELAVFRFGKEFKPDVIFLNGDIIDNYAVSHYEKNPQNEQELTRDVRETKSFLKRIRQAFPKAEIIYIFGNHEHRLEVYIVHNAPELFPFVNLEEILGLKELDIRCIRSSFNENWIKYGDLYIGHYDCAKSTSAATAQYLLNQKGVSLVQGHVHRVGLTAKTLLDRTIYGYENPGLLDKKVEYAKDPNWQQGFSVIYFDEGSHWLYPVIIKNKTFVWSGKKYKA